MVGGIYRELGIYLLLSWRISFLSVRASPSLFSLPHHGVREFQASHLCEVGTVLIPEEAGMERLRHLPEASHQEVSKA